MVSHATQNQVLLVPGWTDSLGVVLSAPGHFCRIWVACAARLDCIGITHQEPRAMSALLGDTSRCGFVRSGVMTILIPHAQGPVVWLE